jgi:glycosyltransferase involved in cell wall biosynthesis
MIKLAYICEPQLGGTFTYFLRLRPVLLSHGLDMRCVTLLPAERLCGTPFAGVDGVECVGCGEEDLPGATRQLVAFLEAGQFDLVMILPGTDMVSSNLPAYLPRAIRCVIRVPMMTRGAYAPTQAVAAHLNRIYAVSDRISDDLIRRYGIPRDQVEVVYHGIDPSPFADALAEKSRQGAVRLLYAGRLWDIDKGVFLLPEIMKKVLAAGADVQLTVAGSGPDEAELRSRFERAGVMARVVMAGGLSHEEMRAQFRAADVFVFPSRFEGFGFAVLEAMAAGCAPVVSDIRGSLRVIVDEGRAGGLARVGDASDFARVITALAQDRASLRALQEKAQARVRDTFTLERMAARYATSLKAVLHDPETRIAPRSLDHYEVPRAFQPTWRTRIPRPIKNFLRMWMERFGVSS